MKWTHLFLIFLFLGASANICELFGQEQNDNRVIVHLKNGSKFEANLVEWNQEAGIIKLEAFGSIVEFENKEIKSVVQKNLSKTEIYNFEEQGSFYQVRVNLITGNPGGRADYEPGIGISLAAGKRLSRKLSLAGGLSFDQYIIGTSENILSGFGEVSGYLHPENLSLSYSLAAGYGFAFKNEEETLTSATGGLMIYPAVGFRWGKKHLKWTLDFGYKFQKAHWVYEAWDIISDQNILYRRLTVRTGVMF